MEAIAPTTKPSLTPADWLQTAADVLVSKSVEGVRVDVLAKTLGVTRGSFYWHFTDRDDLLRRLLLSWKQTQTVLQMDAYERKYPTPAHLLRAFTELPHHGRTAVRGGAIELAIRAWARRDDMAREVVDEVDAMRMRHITTCFKGLGFDDASARNRAFVLYSYMQGESIFRSQGDAAAKAERRAFIEQLLVVPDASLPPTTP